MSFCLLTVSRTACAHDSSGLQHWGDFFQGSLLGELHVLMTQIRANQSPSGDRVSSAPKIAFYLKISLFPISDWRDTSS